MSGYQPEDNLLPECLDVLHGKRPRHDVWKKYCHPTSTHNVGSSPNWYAMAAGVAVHQRDRDAIETLRGVLSEPNDMGQQEALTDDEHLKFRLVGWWTALVGANKMNDQNLVTLLREHIRQTLAMMFLCSTDPSALDKAFIVFPGQRAASPKTEKSGTEYLWLRGIGYTHESIRKSVPQGKSICKKASRVYKNQEDFTFQKFIDLVEDQIALDVLTVERSYRDHGWQGIKSHILRGTRGAFEFVRFANEHLFVSILRKDFGTDNPRLVSLSRGSGKITEQFPSKKMRRTNTKCWASINVDTRRVSAYDSLAGTYSASLPPGDIVFHLLVDPAGIESYLLRTPPPVIEPPPTVETKPKKKSWWQRFLDWF